MADPILEISGVMHAIGAFVFALVAVRALTIYRTSRQRRHAFFAGGALLFALVLLLNGANLAGVLSLPDESELLYSAARTLGAVAIAAAILTKS